MSRVSSSVPFLSQEEITYIPVLDPVSAHIELIERNNVLWEVITDAIIRAKLAVHRFIGGEQIAHLNVQLFAALVAYKVNFLIACSADSHFITPAQQFQIDDVFQTVWKAITSSWVWTWLATATSARAT